MKFGGAEVDDLRAGREELVEERKGSVSASSARRARVSGAAERRSVSNAGSVSVARPRIERSARRRVRPNDGPCANGYDGIVDEVKGSARLATHAPAFAGALAECSRVR